jgi:arylsulfatase A-like enzyme
VTRRDSRSISDGSRAWIRAGWVIAVLAMLGVRLWNALAGPLMRGYDDHGHVGYILYLDLYRAIPWADQGWSYFHPPLHYLLGWALAQFDSPDVLLRGLAVLGGACSLGIAALAAYIVRLAKPDRPDLALLAFIAIGFLPVYLFTSTMAGNELTAAFLGSLGFALLLGNEVRERPTVARDAAVGLILGLALLTKFSAALMLAAAGATLLLRALRAGANFGAWRRVALRGLVLAGVAVVVASPYYARNVREFGTPFKMSRDNPIVANFERRQPPGSRSWRDLVTVSPRLFADPRPREAHMVHSIWGSAYGQTWADVRSFWDQVEQSRIRRARSLMVTLGLAPSLLALLGAALALRDGLGGRRVRVYVPLFALTLVSLGAFVVFAYQAPQFSALKSSYLLGLTLPFAVFLARGVEALSGLRFGLAAGAAAVAVPAAAAALVNSHGVVLPPMDSNSAIGSLAFQFGNLEDARAYFQARRDERRIPPQIWANNLAAVELIAGYPARAREFFGLYPFSRRISPYRMNAVAVAAALSGRRRRALEELDEAIAAGAGEVGLANRGAVLASLGRLKAAAASLRAALERDPDLVPALHNLAEVEARMGRAEEASEARGRADRAARTGPRGYPYGIPDGLGQYPSRRIDLRWMLWLEGAELRLARAPFRSEDAVAVRVAHATPTSHPNVALIVVDTLRADHLGAYGYPRPTSPHIDAVAREGVLFTRAAAPSSWTLPSVASLFTSRSATEHGVNTWGARIAPRFATLGERFFDAGYRTVGVSGNFVHVNDRSGFARGFDTWETLVFETAVEGDPLLVRGHGPSEVGQRAPTAEEINEVVFENLPSSTKRPLFLYVHYMEPHSGYDPPERHRIAFVSDPAAHAAGAPATSDYLTALARGEIRAAAAERQRIVDLYDAEIAAVDEAIGQLLDALERRGFGDNLVVAITSDHGEEFDDHGGWFHGITLHAESLAVPLVIRDGRRPGPGSARNDPVDLLDVPTTLLALAGVEPAPHMDGRVLPDPAGIRARDLVASLESDPPFEEAVGPRRHWRSLVRWPWKVIVARDGTAHAYQLERDPSESSPLALDHSEISSALRDAVDALIDDPAAPRDERGEHLTPEERKRLRALGYAR